MANLVAPEIPPTQNPILPALSAFVAMSQVSNKRRQLEDQLLRMQFEDEQKQRQMDIQAANYKSLDAYRQMEAGVATTRANSMSEKANKVAENSQRQIDFQDSLNQVGGDPGTAKYRTGLNIVRSQFPDVMATPGGQRIWNGTWNNHALVAKETVMGHAAVVRDFDQQMKSEKLNPYWLENPDQWAYIDGNGKMTSDPKLAVSRALPFDTDEKGTAIFPVSPSAAKTKDIKVWKTLPVDRFDTLVKQHAAYKGVINSIITGAQEPDLAAKPVQSPDESPPPAPADPSARKPNVPYQTPKGTFIWDGNQWQTP